MSASDISSSMAGEAQRRYEATVAAGAKAPKVHKAWVAGLVALGWRLAGWGWVEHVGEASKSRAGC